jgi:lipopolysaccharide/colanic/teichoic acid biosynthesis glycosyltransferase/glycosyltransferase involved in cell wall biosynthesis
MSERVAIVHDWLMSMRGSERVVEVLCSLFPKADLFTLTWDPARLSPALAQRRATTSAIHSVASAPFVNGRFRALLPLFPMAVESFKLGGYGLVVSSSHCVAIGAIAPPKALHVAYVHSTLRYVREAQHTYEASIPGGSVGRAAFRGAARYLRRWETAAAARPHALIANSTYTRERVRRYYQRDAVVIEPPIETDRFERAAARVQRPDMGAPFLLVSALVPNKRVDLALRAFRGRPEPLVVVGEGAERARLEGLCGPNVRLLPRVGEAELEALYAGCRALLHTAVDDFGMAMVEALAAGKPVLACAEGGALDIVRDGETGLLIEAPTVESIRAALDRFELLRNRFDPATLQSYARRFDRAIFERRFARAVEDARRQHHDHAHANGQRNGKAYSNGQAQPDTHTRREANGRLNGNGQTHDDGPTNGSSPANAAFKRLVDIALAGSGLVLAAPLLAVFGALITLDSAGPILFFQRRPGLNGQPFTLVKLCTMDTSGRVTRIGRFLRPTGLDELPQLWNVLKGEMSLIGPRPEVLERAQRFECDLPGYGARHAIRPGITGWAQVNGMRGDVSIAKRLEFDIEYVRQQSLALDGRILLRTLSTVWNDTLDEFRG